MIIKADTKISNEFMTTEGVTFTVTEHEGETYLTIHWANGERALDYELRITALDAQELSDLFKAVER